MMPLLLVFLAIFAPVLNIGGSQIDTQAIFFLGMTLIALLTGDLWKFLNNRTGGTLLLLLFGLAVYGFVSGLIISPDRGIAHAGLRVVRATLTLLGCFAVLATIARRKQVDIARLPLVSLMFYAITLHGLIMVAQFFLPGFRDAIYEYTVDRERIAGARLFFSMAGLTSGGGAQLSVYQSVGLLLVPLMWRDCANFRQKLGVGFCAFLCLFSVFITGRSGLLVLLLFLPILVLMLGRNAREVFRTATIAFVGVGSIMLVLFAVKVDSDATDRDSENPVVALASVAFRAQEVLFGEDETLSKLATDHLVLPEDPRTLVFGNPRLIENDQDAVDRIVDSDIGYIRLWFGYGLLGSLFHYLFYVFALMVAVRVYRRRDRDRNHAAFAVVFCLVILFFHLKEVFVLTRIGFSITCFSLVVLSYQLVGAREPSRRKVRAGLPSAAPGGLVT